MAILRVGTARYSAMVDPERIRRDGRVGDGEAQGRRTPGSEAEGFLGRVGPRPESSGRGLGMNLVVRSAVAGVVLLVLLVVVRVLCVVVRVRVGVVAVVLDVIVTTGVLALIGLNL